MNLKWLKKKVKTVHSKIHERDKYVEKLLGINEKLNELESRKTHYTEICLALNREIHILINEIKDKVDEGLSTNT